MQSYHYQTILIFLVNLSNGLATSVISPFVDSIVMSFDLVDSRNSTAYYTGMLNASFMFARIFSIPVWGVVIDCIGRRKSVIVSQFATLLASATFPFASTYWEALANRLILGALSCSAVACRATATEVCPPEYKAKALLYFSMGFQIGTVSGSCVGGILINPALLPKQLANFPYALPNLFSAAFCVVVTVLVILFYKETLDTSVSQGKRGSTAAYGSFFRDPFLRRLVLIICINEVMQSGVSGVFTSWCWAEADRGGLKMSQEDMGWVYSLSTVVLLILQNCCYTRLLNRLGSVAMIKATVVVALPTVLLLPMTTVLGAWQLAGMLVGLTMMNYCSFQVYTSVFLITSSYVKAYELGKINAFIIIYSSVSRCLTPLAINPAFAWSLNVNHFPLNLHLVFMVIALLLSVEVLLAFRLTKEQKEDPQIEIAEVLIHPK